MGMVPLAIRGNLFRTTSTDFAVIAEFDYVGFQWTYGDTESKEDNGFGLQLLLNAWS